MTGLRIFPDGSGVRHMPKGCCRQVASAALFLRAPHAPTSAAEDGLSLASVGLIELRSSIDRSLWRSPVSMSDAAC